MTVPPPDEANSQRTQVLIAEDEESFVDALLVGLEREGFEVTPVRDGVEALDTFRSKPFDIVLLDVMLPRMSGLDVCRAIRMDSDVPVIMVSAKTTEIDTVVGLEVGADDYVAKPYRLRELVSRMRAVLRRRGPLEPTEGGGPATARAHGSESVLRVAEVTVDLDRHECHVRGAEVSLPLKEFELLTQLMLSAGRVVTREALIDRVWGYDYVGDTKTLDVHIKRLRSRIEVDPSKPALITTIRGLGYRFEESARR